jgi:uncharacterized protein YbaR (Trm112 family)
MAFSPELIEIIECPVDRGKVELTADGNGLKCKECKRVYPIRGDIPVLLADEATLEGSAEEDTPQSA